MQTEKLKPCPFCGGEMQLRHALWPSEGDTDAVIHNVPGGTDCPIEGAFTIGTADEGVSVAAAWNRRPSPSGDADLVERLRARVERFRQLVDDQEGGDAVVLVQRQEFNRTVGEMAAAAAALEAAAPLRAELEEMRALVAFVRKWAWDSPLSETERLSAIKYHPAIKPTSPNKGEDDA